MQLYPNSDITTDHVHAADIIRGYTCLEIYPADLTPEQLADIQVCPNEDLIIERQDWRPNKIVNSIAVLIAGLFANATGYSGIGYLALGSGLSAWDTGHDACPGRDRDSAGHRRDTASADDYFPRRGQQLLYDGY